MMNLFKRIMSRRNASHGSDRGHSRREAREPIIGATVQVNDATYAVRDWSSAGFCAAGDVDGFETRDKIPIAATLPLASGTLRIEGNAIIVRVEPEKGTFAGVFVNIAPETRRAIAAYFEEKNRLEDVA